MTTEYRYNHEGRMYAVERGGSRLGEYYYNVFGQLVLRIVTNTVPSGWTVYFYDQQGHLIAEYDGISADLLREYVWLGDTPIAVIEAGVTPATHYIHTDHIGRPIALTDASGSLVNESTWVVFGNAWSVTGSVGVDLRFPGQMYQYESGLHYNWNRQYDPSIARYTQPDPLGLVDGPSRYTYARNDPLQKTDPTGLWTFSIHGLDQANGAREGRYVPSMVINDAICNPIRIDPYKDGIVNYTGRGAIVGMNPITCCVTTVIPRSF